MHSKGWLSVGLLNAHWAHQRVTPHLNYDRHVQGDVEGIISSPLQLSILDVTKVKTIIIFYIFYILERAKCLDGKYLFGHSK